MAVVRARWTRSLGRLLGLPRAQYRYCGGRCIRLAGHVGAHVDGSGRYWT